MKIIKWGLICAALALLGVWIVGDWKGLAFIFTPLILWFKSIFGGGPLDELDRESAQDLQIVKRRKKELRETNNISDLSARLTRDSKWRERKDTSR